MGQPGWAEREPGRSRGVDSSKSSKGRQADAGAKRAPAHLLLDGPLPDHSKRGRMSRVILVSNRVTDLRKAAQAGGVAVALAHIARTRPSLWFGWRGEIKPAEEAHTVQQSGAIVTLPLSPAAPQPAQRGHAQLVLAT